MELEEEEGGEEVKKRAKEEGLRWEEPQGMKAGGPSGILEVG
jgi:hypothetical protein